MESFALSIGFAFWAILYHQGSADDSNTLECYYCINDCELPLNSLTCHALNNNVSCYSSMYTENGTIEHLKGCAIDADTDFQAVCGSIIEEGGSCYTCQQNLCNESD